MRKILKDQRIRILLYAIPAYIGALYLTDLLDFLSQKDLRLILIVLVPSLFITGYLALPLFRKNRIALGGGNISFFIAFCISFTLLTNLAFISGSREPITSTDTKPPPSLFGLDLIEDWHFKLAPESKLDNDILVVGLPSFEGMLPMISRGIFLRLMEKANRENAKALVFDYTLANEESGQEQNMLRQLMQAGRQGIPMCFCQDVQRDTVEENKLHLVPMPEVLREELHPQGLGHCMLFWQADGKIRMAPRFLNPEESDAPLPSLAEQVARGIDPGVRVSGSQDFLFLKEIGSTVEIIEYDPSAELPSFADKIVFVGSTREGDLKSTPFDDEPMWGVTVQAMLTASLLADNTITYLNRNLIFLLIFVVCFLLVLLQSSTRIKSASTLLAGAAILSVGVILLAVLGIMFSNVWINVSYPMVAIWLLTGFLWGGARVRASWNKSNAAASELSRTRSTGAAQAVDVFLILERNALRESDDWILNELETQGVTYTTCAWDDGRWTIPEDRIHEEIALARNVIVLYNDQNAARFQHFVQNLVKDIKNRSTPIILINAAEQFVPFDLKWSMKREYDMTALMGPKFRELIWDVTGRKPKVLMVFVSYAHEDDEFKTKLERTLDPAQTRRPAQLLD